MDHLAIMVKSWGFMEKIASGEKKIESRWYKTRRAPWDQIKIGDTVYFKNSGEMVSLKAKVKKVSQLSNLTSRKIKSSLQKYHQEIGLNKQQVNRFFKKIRDAKYGILVFLKQPVKIKSFKVDKAGFGSMAAWLTIENINQIKN